MMRKQERRYMRPGNTVEVGPMFGRGGREGGRKQSPAFNTQHGIIEGTTRHSLG